MRHRKKSEKFSRTHAPRKALVKSLLRALFIYERITTTESKAKGMRHWAERLINWAKNDNLHNRRLAFQYLCDHNLVKRLFEVIGPRFKNVNGGYTRIFDLCFRPGDGARCSILELTKLEKKEKKHRKEKKEVEEKEEESPKEKPPKLAPKKEQPKKGLISGMKNIFKKERDSL